MLTRQQRLYIVVSVFALACGLHAAFETSRVQGALQTLASHVWEQETMRPVPVAPELKLDTVILDPGTGLDGATGTRQLASYLWNPELERELRDPALLYDAINLDILELRQPVQMVASYLWSEEHAAEPVHDLLIDTVDTLEEGTELPLLGETDALLASAADANDSTNGVRGTTSISARRDALGNPARETAGHLQDEAGRLEADPRGVAHVAVMQRMENGSVTSVTRALQDEGTPSHDVSPLREFIFEADVASYLWDEERRAAEEQVASYLRDEEQHATEAVASYLWDEEQQGADVQVASYLWDEEQHATETVASYLEDEERLAAEAQVASYLWSGEGAAREGNSQLYLQDGSPESAARRGRNPDGLASPWQNKPMLASVAQPLARPYIVRGRSGANSSDVRRAVQAVGGTVTHNLGVINAVGAELTPAQYDAVTQMPALEAPFEPNPVQTAALHLGAAAEPTLTFTGNRVDWTIQNIGRRDLVVQRVIVSWPEENGEVVTVAQDGTALSARQHIDANGNLRMHGLKPRRAIPGDSEFTLSFTFAGEAAQNENEYDIRVEFRQGIAVEFAADGPTQGKRRDTFFPTLVAADRLHREGITGDGVGVAVLDTGSWKHKGIVRDTQKQDRVVAYYDATTDTVGGRMIDGNGHGSHIASVIASSLPTRSLDGDTTGSYNGIAPDVDLVIVKAFDADGQGSYMDVIRGIEFVIENRDRHNIRVLNLSFGGEPVSHYWQDPLNLAVMRAWEAGIVVIVSAGNTGPDPMTIGVPGNVPYVVTVGAMTDAYTPDDTTDDYLAPFSSSGPTLEGHVKPEIIAPGGHISGLMRGNTTVAKEHPEFHDGFQYYAMSGTSQAAGVAAGVAALIAQQTPHLTADDIKCRLLASANAAFNPEGGLAYSVFQQGAGLINAYTAVHGFAEGCSNQGIDVSKDLAGVEHYGGPAVLGDDGFGITGVEGYVWNLSGSTTNGYVWNLSDLQSAGYVWNLSSAESNGYVWNLSSTENDGSVWKLNSLERSGYVWNLLSARSSGFVWNLSTIESYGYVWNLSTLDLRSASYRWVDQI